MSCYSQPCRTLPYALPCPSAGMATSATEPIWTDLPLDLWRLVLTHAAQQLVPRPLEAGQAWVHWCRLLSSAASTSKTLRAAVLGPGCEPLWAETGFRSAYDGLSQVRLAGTHCAKPRPARSRDACCLQVQSSGLNQLLSRQGPHAHRACIYGCGWDLQELHCAAGSLASLDGHLELLSIHDAEEAGCLGTALSSCPVASVVYVGVRTLHHSACNTLS